MGLFTGVRNFGKDVVDGYQYGVAERRMAGEMPGVPSPHKQAVIKEIQRGVKAGEYDGNINLDMDTQDLHNELILQNIKGEGKWNKENNTDINTVSAYRPQRENLQRINEMGRVEEKYRGQPWVRMQEKMDDFIQLNPELDVSNYIEPHNKKWGKQQGLINQLNENAEKGDSEAAAVLQAVNRDTKINQLKAAHMHEGDYERHLVFDEGVLPKDLSTDQLAKARGHGQIYPDWDQYNSHLYQQNKLRLAGDHVDDIVGAGAFGVVLPGKEAGTVTKRQLPKGIRDQFRFVDSNAEHEVNMMAEGAELGIAPEVKSFTTTKDGITETVMQDYRDNYTEYEPYMKGLMADPNMPYDDKIRAGSKVEMNIQKQLGNFADKGFMLTDRHSGNVALHDMTGRPMQLDYGFTSDVRNSPADQTVAIAAAVERGFDSAGLGDMSSIYHDTIQGLLNEGKTEDALDVARQGLTKLNEIQTPLREDLNIFTTSEQNPDKVRLGLNSIKQRIGDRDSNRYLY